MKKSIFLFFAAILCAIGMNAATWTVAGSDAKILNGTSTWDPGDTKNDMTNVSGTKWGLLVMNKSLDKTTYKFKICKDHGWGTAYPGSDYNFTIGAAGTYNIIYRFNTSGNSVGADYFKTWTVAGSGAVLTDDWKPEATANDMTQNGNTFEYVLTKQDVKLEKGTTYECKVCKDHAWGKAYPGDNHKYSVETTGYYDVTFKFNVATETVDVTTTLINCKVTTSANPTEGGSVTATKEYAKGSSVTLTATPADGYEFVNWTKEGAVVSTSKTYTFTVLEDVSLVANFKVPVPDVVKYHVTVSANNNTMGNVTGGGEYEEGATALLTATPNPGYQFKNWTVADAEVSTANPYTFTVNADITVTANFEETPKETVYFVNNGGWTSVSIYGWGGSVTGTGINNWSGVPMTKTGETLTIDGKNYDIYSYSAEVGAVKNILFNYNGDANKTSDFVWTNGNYYYFGAAKDFEGTTKEGVVTALSTPLPDETVYFVNNKKWDGVAIYGWGGTASTSEGIGKWAGVAMTKTAEKVAGFDVYSYTVKQGSVANILFNYNGDENKSANFVWTNGKYYYMGAAENYAGGTEEEVAAALATPVPTYDYYVIGTINNWRLEDAAYGMELNGEVYEKQVTLVASQKHELKINNGKWENENTFGYDQLSVKYEGVSRGSGEGDNNIVIELTENKTITVKLDKNTKKVTLDGLTESTAPTQYYVVGTFTENWTNAHADYELTLDGEVYKKSLTLDAGEHMFKITDGTWNDNATWGYGNITGSYVEIDEGTNNEGEKNGNIKVTLAAQKTFTVIFDATAGKITFDGLTPYVTPLTYTVIVPPGTEKCYIAGNMNGWAFQEMEAVTGETNKFTITIVGAKETDEYKYACQADWAYAEVIDGGGNRTNWTALDEVTEWGKPVIVTYQLKGVGGWEQPGIEMEQNPGKASEYMLTCQAISATDAIKVVRLEDGVIKDYYGNGTVKDEVTVAVSYDGEANIKLPEGKYNFYFDTNASEKKLWIEAATDCGPATITLTTDDNSAVIAANIGNTVNVKIERSFTTNDGYYTLCVPFNMPASVIGKAYSLGTITEHVSGEGININLEEESELSAGVPYLVLPKANMSELVVENVTIQSDIASGQNIYSEELNVNIFFEGFYSASGQTNGTTQYYVGNNGYLYNGEVEIRGLCGLFTITDKDGNPIKVRARVVTREEVETGLDNNQLPNINIQKVLENGQLIIIREGVKYNVQGQKL